MLEIGQSAICYVRWWIEKRCRSGFIRLRQLAVTYQSGCFAAASGLLSY
jgi:hypothetical protein